MIDRRARIAAIVAVVVGGVLLGRGMSRAGVLLIVSRPIHDPQAIIVLASHEWERLPEAARAARGNDAILLLTLPVTIEQHNCFECGKRIQWLSRLGVPETRVKVLRHRVTNTYDEAVAAREYVLAQRFRRLLIVTSPYHTRRSLATFDSVFGGSATEIGIVAARDSPANPARWWSTAYDRWYVRYEWSALTWYALRHGVDPFVG
jgi:uncharacterized SAM-binding protein YcdF (DUF218 family)